MNKINYYETENMDIIKQLNKKQTIDVLNDLKLNMSNNELFELIKILIDNTTLAEKKNVLSCLCDSEAFKKSLELNGIIEE